MPISAENRKRYPKDWQAIRAAILERAERRCEFCGVPHGALIIRGQGLEAGTFIIATSGAIHDAQTGALLGYAPRRAYAGRKLTRVILTTAHLDHTPEHNDPANLRALCQRCHLAYDAEHHQQTAYETRRRPRALRDLFDHA